MNGEGCQPCQSPARAEIGRQCFVILQAPNRRNAIHPIPTGSCAQITHTSAWHPNPKTAYRGIAYLGSDRPQSVWARGRSRINMRLHGLVGYSECRCTKAGSICAVLGARHPAKQLLSGRAGPCSLMQRSVAEDHFLHRAHPLKAGDLRSCARSVLGSRRCATRPEHWAHP